MNVGQRISGSRDYCRKRKKCLSSYIDIQTGFLFLGLCKISEHMCGDFSSLLFIKGKKRRLRFLWRIYHCGLAFWCVWRRLALFTIRDTVCQSCLQCRFCTEWVWRGKGRWVDFVIFKINYNKQCNLNWLCCFFICILHKNVILYMHNFYYLAKCKFVYINLYQNDF